MYGDDYNERGAYSEYGRGYDDGVDYDDDDYVEVDGEDDYGLYGDDRVVYYGGDYVGDYVGDVDDWYYDYDEYG